MSFIKLLRLASRAPSSVIYIKPYFSKISVQRYYFYFKWQKTPFLPSRVCAWLMRASRFYRPILFSKSGAKVLKIFRISPSIGRILYIYSLFLLLGCFIVFCVFYHILCSGFQILFKNRCKVTTFFRDGCSLYKVKIDSK